MDEKFSFANISNLTLIEGLYEQYLENPESVDPSWCHFFEGMQFATLSHKIPSSEESPDLRIYHLIESYRVYGHLCAEFNPMSSGSKEVPELSLENHHFRKEEWGENFPTCGFLKEGSAPLSKIVEALKKTYCGKIGIEYMGLVDPELEKWLQERIEPNFDLKLTKEDKLDTLRYLNKAELFESFIHIKYVGQKRFSLEGEESFIPFLGEMIESGAAEGLEEVYLGMAHRGRLNVLANILNKSYAQIFHEFEDYYTPDLLEGTGDVKYHKGFEGNLPLKSGKTIKVILEANPSHLESVDPIVEGKTRARQQLKKNVKGVLPVIVHGDAAVAGQGVVYETLELSRLNGYKTGGTIHIVINNQIGFTTLPKDSRSTRYCTDIAKTVGAPVFHVSAEDPEGCVAVAKIAIALRQKFHCDLFIDLVGYRKYGHNEGDEPGFTQPLEYQIIKKKKNIRELYRDQLIQEGVLSQQEANDLEGAFKESLHRALESVKTSSIKTSPKVKVKGDLFIPTQTAVSADLLKEVAKIFCTVPADFHLHSKLQRQVQERLQMVEGGGEKPTIDWGMGEHLAYATLLWEGIHIRLSGQDSRRGTFSHRHAMWVDQVNNRTYFPLSHLKEGQALFDVYNSPLSEYAVLGFDYGYSIAYPQSLVIWEAQFGDFCNGAQIIIDQYIATCEQKWNQPCNLTLKLPHGYEGQGPEHSSSRMERFLQLCGEENMQVVNATTPAQLFHVLRRQALREVKKPLILFTPKAMLRHPLCVSPLSAFTTGTFQEIVDDPTPPSRVRRLAFCSGKIYFDLIQKRQAEGLAVIRIEQLYPLNGQQIRTFLEKYRGYDEVVWIQEEHENMGAWHHIHFFFSQELQVPIRYIGRGRSASPAAGSHALHKQQQEVLMDQVLKGIT